MDKVEFVDKAPLYYALGIALAMDQLYSSEDVSAKSIVQLDSVLEQSPYRYFQKQPLIDHAAKILYDCGVIDIIDDDFGPSLYKVKSALPDWLKEASRTRFPLFRKFAEHGNREWLKSALKSVNSRYEDLKIAPSDFDEDEIEIRWEPIPLDRNDEKLLTATEAVDEAIKEIEADNGYAVHAPGEREYVLFNLKNMSKLLKEETQIYWMQIKTFALDPLARVIKRFGPAAVGVVALAAKDAIFDWLKTHFAKALDWL